MDAVRRRVREARTLSGYAHQRTLPSPACATSEVVRAAWGLLEGNEPLDATHPLCAL